MVVIPHISLSHAVEDETSKACQRSCGLDRGQYRAAGRGRLRLAPYMRDIANAVTDPAVER
jgi:hypothetical protein